MEHLFAVGHRFVGPEVDLVVERLAPSNPERGWNPAYETGIMVGEQRVGGLRVRVGYSDALVFYSGHLGYEVEPEFRGHAYAGKACQVAREILLAHGMDTVWITCNPDNDASRRTLERLGLTYVNTVDIPPDSPMFLRGDRQKMRFRWTVM